MTRRKSRDQRLALIRNVVIVFAVILIVGVGGYGLFYGSGVGAPDSWVEGEHYRVLDNPRPLRAGAPLAIVEFFSYGCIHCRNLDPLIEAWEARAPEDVDFQRMPVSFGGPWVVLARGFYALEATNALSDNHDRLFRAIHDQGKSFVSVEMLADFVDGHGVDRAAFLAAYNSPDVGREATVAERRTRLLGVTAVPTLIVAERYLINVGDVGRAQALDLVDHLLARVRKTPAARTEVTDPDPA